MAYNGFLIKVGNYIVPQRFIKPSTYDVTYITQDADTYVDGNGNLHREALENRKAKVEFETVAMLTDDDYDTLFRNLEQNYTNNKEKKALCTIYIPETREYVTQEMYLLPEIHFSIYGTYGGKIHYNPTRLAFIAY